MLKYLVLGLFILPLSACDQMGQKQQVGTVVGGASGALLGSQIGGGSGRGIAIAVGTLVGGLLGNEVGRNLDTVDRMEANQAFQRATRSSVGETITWNNPNSGNHGTIKAVRDGRTSAGDYCREFQQSVTIAGETQKMYGTACRQPDGSWKAVN